MPFGKLTVNNVWISRHKCKNSGNAQQFCRMTAGRMQYEQQTYMFEYAELLYIIQIAECIT